MASVELRLARESDLPAIVEIYAEGVEDGTANCELSPLTDEAIEAWREEHEDDRYPVFVAAVEGDVLGWTALSPYDRKPCFDRTASSSTYVRRSGRGRGIGTALRVRLIEEARARGFHTIVNRIFVTNEQSLALTERLGFVRVGYMPELAWKDGEPQDCAFYQLRL